MIDLILCYLIIGSLLSCYWEFEEAILFADWDIFRLCPPSEMTVVECFFGYVVVAVLWPLYAFLWKLDDEYNLE